VNGPINYWDGEEPNPVTGQPWPDIIPFTGYLNLAIEANGRAVDANGYPVTTAVAGSVADTRVRTLANQNTQGGAVGHIPQKWTALTDDIPIINWKEMRLIRAEAEPASAVQHVNAIRTRDNLPLVTYNPTGEQIENMIIEERRRALWLEGRFWATKILNTDKLFFPRLEGVDQYNHDLLGGVRLVYPLEEYRLNPNLTEEDRGLGCRDNEWSDQAPELGLGDSV
jgi:hypothetical protein